jgi:hypothetical protein
VRGLGTKIPQRFNSKPPHATAGVIFSENNYRAQSQDYETKTPNVHAVVKTGLNRV